jgi:hypothetical protein
VLRLNQEKAEKAEEAHTNDGDVVLGRLKLPECNVDRDTSLALGLELVKNPGWEPLAFNPPSLECPQSARAPNYSPYLKEPLPSSAASCINY